jgi:hypothetical protein
MERSLLVRRLAVWCERLGEHDLLACAAHLYGKNDLSLVPRVLLEKVRDRLARAQERNQFSDEADQEDLAQVVAGLDEVRAKTPTN